MTDLRIGDMVKVKKGVHDPDIPELDISHWQGRITDIDSSGQTPMVRIQWDSMTLESMPDWVIEKAELGGMDWSSMYLEANEVEPVSPRDTPSDRERIYNRLAESHAWDYLGEQGRRISQVLADSRARSNDDDEFEDDYDDDDDYDEFDELDDEFDDDVSGGFDGHDYYDDEAPDDDDEDEIEDLEAWLDHLNQQLVFPFEAEIAEHQEGGPLQAGDRVTVLGLDEDVDDLYGILASCRFRRQTFVFPLVDLEVVDKNSPNYQPVDDYSVWFSNR